MIDIEVYDLQKENGPPLGNMGNMSNVVSNTVESLPSLNGKSWNKNVRSYLSQLPTHFRSQLVSQLFNLYYCFILV